MWEATKAEQLNQWDRETARAYDWARAGRSAEDAVWQACLEDESRPPGFDTILVALDLEKCYETIFTCFG